MSNTSPELSLTQRLKARGAENKALQALSGECCTEPESVPLAQKPKRRRTGSDQPGAAKGGAAQQKQQPMVLSLLDLPAGWEQSFSLSALKQVAARAANLEEGWQRIGSEHRAELVEALSTAAAAWRSFAESVLPFDAAVAKGQKKLKQSDPRRASVERVVGAAVHLVPSGSGVHLGEGLVLTCAHCVDHDDDDDDESQPRSPQTREFAAGGGKRPLTRTERVAYDEAHAAWRATTKAAAAAALGARRIGRLKTVVTARGAHGVAECVATDEASDVALLRYVDGPPEGLGALRLGGEGDDVEGTPVLAVGNPYDWDLEGAAGAKPRKNGYTPFWVSAGKLQGEIESDDAAAKGVGPQRHGCWTYWGHSGCPIVGVDGAVLAMHNSWDDTNGQRHAVPLRAMRALAE